MAETKPRISVGDLDVTPPAPRRSRMASFMGRGMKRSEPMYPLFPGEIKDLKMFNTLSTTLWSLAFSFLFVFIDGLWDEHRHTVDHVFVLVAAIAFGIGGWKVHARAQTKLDDIIAACADE